MTQLHRIDVHDAVTGERLGYLRKVGRELSLVLPVKKGAVASSKPPLLVEDPASAEDIVRQFQAMRRARCDSSLPEMKGVAVPHT